MDYSRLPNYLAKRLCVAALLMMTSAWAYEEADFLRVEKLKRCQNCSLSYVDFEGADLTGVELSGAKLTGAYFAGANLSFANLAGADLTTASLFEANLSGANLSLANLTAADLNGANLSDADLTGAILSGADLYGATFCRTQMPSGELNDEGCEQIEVVLRSISALSYTDYCRLQGCGVPATATEMAWGSPIWHTARQQ